jgi:protein-tyrosine-phosphatase
MISTNLQNLSDWTVTWAAKGERMPPDAAAHLAKVLLDLSHQAAQLERLPVDNADLLVFPKDLIDG